MVSAVVLRDQGNEISRLGFYWVCSWAELQHATLLVPSIVGLCRILFSASLKMSLMILKDKKIYITLKWRTLPGTFILRPTHQFFFLFSFFLSSDRSAAVFLIRIQFLYFFDQLSRKWIQCFDLPLSCWINQDATPTSNFQPIRLLDLNCCYKFIYLMTISADPDQLASSNLIWIYTVCKGRVYPGSAGQGLKSLVWHGPRNGKHNLIVTKQPLYQLSNCAGF